MEKSSQKEFHSIKRLSKNYIGLTAEKTINVVSCNTGKEVFVSDKLSNMSQSIYNQETKKLLVYNTSGYAYLYQLPDGKRLLPKIYLKQSDIWSEQIIWEGDFCWYPSFRKGIYRLNTRTGEVVVCIPSSRQSKKYKIFVLPGVYGATFLCRQSLLFMKFHWC